MQLGGLLEELTVAKARAGIEKLVQITDLYGENLLLIHRGWSHYVDQLRDDLWQHHQQIRTM